MAAFGLTSPYNYKVFLVVAVILVLLVFFLDEVDGRRGGGGMGRGGGRRGSKSSSRSRSRGSLRSSRTNGSYRNVILKGRITKGSSPYTIYTWRNAALDGEIYGGKIPANNITNWMEMPRICTNNYDKRPEGYVYGFFICPRVDLNESADDVYCCGPEKKEFCCSLSEARIYYGSSPPEESSMSTAQIIVSTLGLLIQAAIVYRSYHYIVVQIKAWIQKRSKKDHHGNPSSSRPPEETPLEVTVDNMDEPINNHCETPSAPPPSYGQQEAAQNVNT